MIGKVRYETSYYGVLLPLDLSSLVGTVRSSEARKAAIGSISYSINTQNTLMKFPGRVVKFDPHRNPPPGS